MEEEGLDANGCRAGFVLTPSLRWFIMLQDWFELRVITSSQNRAVNGTDGGVWPNSDGGWLERWPSSEELAALADGPAPMLSIYLVALLL